MPGPPTPNMNLIQPTINGDFNTWGGEINSNNTTVDGHTHQIGSGVPITPLGMNINQDLSIQGNNINLVRALRMNNQSVVLTGAGDVAEVYVKGGDLYYNNASGIPVQVTNGTVVNAPGIAATVFPQTSASSNFTILSSASYIEVLVQTSGAFTVTLPTAASMGAGRYFIIKDVSGGAATHNLTIAAHSGDTVDNAANIKFVWNYQSAFFVSDGVSNWNIVGGQKTTIGTGETLTVAGDVHMSSGTIDGYGTVSGTLVVTGAVQADATGAVTAITSSGITSGVAGGIALTGGSSDWITYSPARTQTLWTNIVPLSLGSNITWTLNQNGHPFYGFVGVLQSSLTGAVDNAFAFDIPRRNGATLSSVTLTFVVANNTLPAVLPTLSINRAKWTPGSSSNVVYLNSGDSGVGGGLPISTATTGAQWYSSGNIQAFTYTCNQNNVMDTTQYTYFGSVVGESGSGATAGDLYMAITCVYSNITNTQF